MAEEENHVMTPITRPDTEVEVLATPEDSATNGASTGR